jgi:hypothetical protein
MKPKSALTPYVTTKKVCSSTPCVRDRKKFGFIENKKERKTKRTRAKRTRTKATASKKLP